MSIKLHDYYYRISRLFKHFLLMEQPNLSLYQPKTITIALSTVMGRPIELRLHRRASKKRNNQQESTRVADGSRCATKYHGKLAKPYYGSTSRHVNEWMDGWKKDSQSGVWRFEPRNSKGTSQKGTNEG